ncbi:MAG TPA: flavodoxin-dependent (E)-4-hydroxy-3-methylbut-2-enyl-diphosphate synthase, partial [Syntrophales bacterium]|nr:flavodoxin-dependent (E)-4-hydroxy-3-methylbut-2-enyl-diphosphate synthase [Syntrophales bacterium]
VRVGGDAPVVVQSMTNTDTRDVPATVAQIRRLEEAGCEIIRVAVPDEAAADALPSIRKGIGIPLIADIHFHEALAVKSLEAGVEGIRINPGNLGEKSIRKIIGVAKERDAAVRIGVNAGSLEKDLLKKYGGPTAEALVESALKNLVPFQEAGFANLKFSLKSSHVATMIEAYRLVADRTDYPLHLGVTEAGTLLEASIKSSIGLGILLYEGIGDTIRVSITGDPVPEVKVAYSILRALGVRKVGPEIISCPTCGRCEIDLNGLAEAVEKRLSGMRDYLKIALMGCVVNGPGEASEADIGIAGGRGTGLLFKKGKAIRKIREEDFVTGLMDEIMQMTGQKEA